MKMLITVSLETLKTNFLSPNEFIYLYTLFHNLELPTYPIDLIKLQKQQFIKITKDVIYPRMYNIKTLFTNEIEEIVKPVTTNNIKKDELEEAWNDLAKIYPHKYQGRYLHQPGSAKGKLKIALQSSPLEEILLGAANENLARKAAEDKNLFFDAPKGLATWLHQKHWMNFLDYEVEIVKSNIRRV